MKLTIWVRPAGYSQYLVYESIDDLEKVFKDMFDSDDFDYFKKRAEQKPKFYEYYDEADMDNCGCITIDTNLGYKEKIEFKWIKMSETDIETLSEFEGW